MTSTEQTTSGTLPFNRGESTCLKSLKSKFRDEDLEKMKMWCKTQHPEKLEKVDSLQSFFINLQEELKSVEVLRDFLLMIGRFDLAKDLKKVGFQHASSSSILTGSQSVGQNLDVSETDKKDESLLKAGVSKSLAEHGEDQELTEVKNIMVRCPSEETLSEDDAQSIGVQEIAHSEISEENGNSFQNHPETKVSVLRSTLDIFNNKVWNLEERFEKQEKDVIQMKQDFNQKLSEVTSQHQQQLQEQEEKNKGMQERLDKITKQLQEQDEIKNKEIQVRLEEVTKQLQEQEEIKNKEIQERLDKITKQLQEQEEKNKKILNKMMAQHHQELKQQQEKMQQKFNKELFEMREQHRKVVCEITGQLQQYQKEVEEIQRYYKEMAAENQEQQYEMLQQRQRIRKMEQHHVRLRSYIRILHQQQKRRMSIKLKQLQERMKQENQQHLGTVVVHYTFLLESTEARLTQEMANMERRFMDQMLIRDNHIATLEATLIRVGIVNDQPSDVIVAQLFDQDQDFNNGGPPAPEDVIENLERVQDFNEEIFCSICQHNVRWDVEPAPDIRVLQCHHRYHFLCIQNWLRTNNTCPECRRIVE